MPQDTKSGRTKMRHKEEDVLCYGYGIKVKSQSTIRRYYSQ
jgi:hypothetical protein